MSIYHCDRLCVPEAEVEVFSDPAASHHSPPGLQTFGVPHTAPQHILSVFIWTMSSPWRMWSAACVVSDGAVINSGSDGGSVDEHQCCLVSSLSLACDIPHQVDDWLTYLATYLIWRLHVIRLSRTIPRNFVYSTKLSSAFPSLMYVLMDYHSGLVCEHVETPLITPVFYLLDRGLHLFCDDLQAPSGLPYGAVVRINWLSRPVLHSRESIDGDEEQNGAYHRSLGSAIFFLSTQFLWVSSCWSFRFPSDSLDGGGCLVVPDLKLFWLILYCSDNR